MKNDKVWDKIDASPLLQLPPEQRKALHEAGDEQFRTLWGDCFAAALTLGQPVDGGDFCRIFLKAFDFLGAEARADLQRLSAQRPEAPERP